MTRQAKGLSAAAALPLASVSDFLAAHLGCAIGMMLAGAYHRFPFELVFWCIAIQSGPVVCLGLYWLYLLARGSSRGAQSSEGVTQ